MDSLDVLSELSHEQVGQLFIAMRDYNNDEDVKLEGLLKAVFIPFKNQFDRDAEKYEAIVLRNRENGKNGGKPKKTQTNPVGFLGTQPNPNKPDNDSDSKSDSDNESKRFRKPNLKQVQEYCQERNMKQEFAEVFIDGMEAKGWIIGNVKCSN